jgi:hypothetical protein
MIETATEQFPAPEQQITVVPVGDNRAAAINEFRPFVPEGVI